MDIQHGCFEVTHVTMKRLALLFLDGEEKVRAPLGPLATLELGHKLIAKLFKRVDRSRWELGVPSSHCFPKGGWEGLEHEGI